MVWTDNLTLLVIILREMRWAVDVAYIDNPNIRRGVGL
jgi:hypothetical protein